MGLVYSELPVTQEFYHFHLLMLLNLDEQSLNFSLFFFLGSNFSNSFAHLCFLSPLFGHGAQGLYPLLFHVWFHHYMNSSKHFIELIYLLLIAILKRPARSLASSSSSSLLSNEYFYKNFWWSVVSHLERIPLTSQKIHTLQCISVFSAFVFNYFSKTSIFKFDNSSGEGATVIIQQFVLVYAK